MTTGEVGEQLRRSTVHIFRYGRRAASSGSGIILRQDGVILTNAHVIGSAPSVAVELWDGRTFTAHRHLHDPYRDLACVTIAATGLPTLELRETPAKPGEPVVAVGNPFGFSGAMTKGSVQGTGSIPRLGRRLWLQAAIRLAPGNSGGPLADVDGRVLGINTMVVGSLALAVPAATIKNFVLHGATPRLGVTVREVTLENGAQGLLILGIERQSPADHASLLLGDIVTQVNGVSIRSAGDLPDLLSESVGSVRLQFLRGGRSDRREVTVVLRNRSATGLAA